MAGGLLCCRDREAGPRQVVALPEPLGVPRVQAIHAAALYHTSADTFETISVEGLERAARFYRFFIEGVANASRGEIDP